MSEAGMWNSLRPKLKKLGEDPIRVENRVGAGTPDVNIRSGWMELKYMPAFTRKGTLRMDHLRPGQVAWAVKHWAARQGGVWLMLKVGRLTWYLVEGRHVPKLGGEVSAEELREMSVGYYPNGLDRSELKMLGAVLRGNPD